MFEAQGFPTGVRGPSAIDSDGLAIDEAAFAAISQEADKLSDVVGEGEAAHRDTLNDIGVAIVATALFFSSYPIFVVFSMRRWRS